MGIDKLGKTVEKGFREDIDFEKLPKKQKKNILKRMYYKTNIRKVEPRNLESGTPEILQLIKQAKKGITRIQIISILGLKKKKKKIKRVLNKMTEIMIKKSRFNNVTKYYYIGNQYLKSSV